METPVVPEDSALSVEEEEVLKQKRHELHKPVDSGEDERGPFDVIPLSMLRGGKAEPRVVHKKPMKHIIVDQSIPPRGWYKNKEEDSDRIRPRPCYSEALLTTPYGGFCHVGCSFCYINNGSRGYRSTGLPTVDPNYPEKFKKQLDKMMVSGAGYMSSFTEVFQILEEEYHNVERLTQVFVESGLPIFYCTRRLPPDWAIEALQQNPYSYIQWSVNTSRPDDYRKFSPGAAKLDDILSHVERLDKLGIYTSFQCNPVNAGITTLDDLLELVNMAADAGLKHIIFKFTEQVANARQVIIDRLKERRFESERVREFSRLFNQVIGGVYTIQQDVRVEWLKELLEATRAADITMSTCYEYYDDGKAGANLAPWFTTSDQCHGRGIPVHYRPAPGEKFRPLPGCYRKGCLACAEHGTKACKSDVLLQAKAMDYKDLRTTVLEDVDYQANWDMADSCDPPEDVRIYCGNPDLRTDAELWGWPTIDEHLESLK